MNVKERFFELKERWKQADETGRKRIDRETETFLDGLTEEERKTLTDAIATDLNQMRKEADDCKRVKERIDMRQRMEDLLPLICISGFAKQYFGKSSSWMHQRVNGNMVNGKQAAFTNEELKILADSFSDLSDRLSALSLSIHRSL